MLKSYSELRRMNVLPFCEHRKAKDDNGKEINVPYLNWAKCKDLLHNNGAEVVYYTPLLTDKGHSLFMSDVEFIDKNGQKNRCYEVRVETVIDDKRITMNYPLLNGTYVVRDDTMNQLRVSNAQARCFVKAVAIHTGLGFELWLKDDVLDTTEEDLSLHSIFKIKERIEKIITAKLQNGLDIKDLYSALSINEKTFNLIMQYPAQLNKFEQMIKKL